jgi:hypothetical protein
MSNTYLYLLAVPGGNDITQLDEQERLGQRGV